MLSGPSCCLTCVSCWKQLGNSKIAATESLDSDATAASTAAEKAVETAAEKAADMAADTEAVAVAETLLGSFQCRENECPDRPPSLDCLLQDDGVDKPEVMQTSWILNRSIKCQRATKCQAKSVGKESNNQ